MPIPPLHWSVRAKQRLMFRSSSLLLMVLYSLVSFTSFVKTILRVVTLILYTHLKVSPTQPPPYLIHATCLSASLPCGVIAVLVLAGLAAFSLAIYPSTPNLWKMTDHMLDSMDRAFIIGNFLPPAILIIASILFLDTTPGRSRDVDRALLSRGVTRKVPLVSLWQARWRFTMGKIVGTWSIGEMLMVIAIIACNLVWWFVPVANRLKSNPDKYKTVKSMSQLLAIWAGWAGIWDAGAAIFFAIRENLLLKHTIGADASQYHRMIRFHVGLGYASFLLETVHGLYFLIQYTIDNRLARSFVPWLSTKGYINFAGIVAYLALVLVTVTSIFKMRRKNYRVFYWTHQLYLVFILFTLIHYHSAWWMFLGPMLYFVYDRLAPSLRSKRNTLAYLQPLTPTLLRIDIPIPESHRIASRYAPGDWSSLNFPTISTLNWHPFSIASYHPSTPDMFTFYIKVRGGWTERLHELAVRKMEKRVDEHGVMVDRRVGVPVKMDGPFGAKSSMYLDFETLVCVGAGTGMAALIPFARHYALRGPEGGRLYIVWMARCVEDVLVYEEFVRESLLKAGSGETVTWEEKEKEGGFVVVTSERGSVEESLEMEKTSLGVKAYYALTALNVMLVLACFGGGVGGYAFARIWAFDFNCFLLMTTCTNNAAYQLTGLKHFTCWYHYYMGPVVLSILFSLFSGFTVLTLASLITTHLTASIPSPTPPSIQKPLTIDALMNAEVKAGRPDITASLNAVLGEREGRVAFMAAGPEKMVVEVQERAVKERRVWFFRESFKA
ncbi:hypothetical protein BC829DRAFT_481362 [Chytridium lagenaria]|nr:hypothetical protein BC829DRAFT_481362 [Chytridium lagenaria]